MIKILAGVRRSGKSYILNMLYDKFKKRNINENHIIYKSFTNINFQEDYSNKDMFHELKNEIKEKDKKYYFLLDEVQEIDGWEKAINSIFEMYNVDIYITESNSKLTSEKISSYLSGRYILIPIYTLSFKEYIDFNKLYNKNIDDVYEEYKKFGGFPILSTLKEKDQNSAYQILMGIYNSIINKDIMNNHPIKDVNQFNRVVKFIMENMGKIFSANSISTYFKSQNRAISIESIYNYITWLKDAFIIYQCNRYDMKGKNVLATQEKYYLSDIGLKLAIFGYNTEMDASILENIIYLELKRRGYEVYIGKFNNKEIDFIAKKQTEEIHIQVTIQLNTDNYDREVNNLLNIKDSYHKYVVTTNRNNEQIIKGIKVIHISDFLLMDKW